jgi:drug/metabolite transporter (DMT)-like permease
MAHRALALTLLVIVMVVWGTTYIATKSVVEESPPLLLALLRFLAAIVVLWPIVFLRGGLKNLPRPFPWRTLFLMSAFGFVLYYATFNYSLLYTSASQGALIQALLPAAVAIAAALYLRERPSKQRILGILLSIVGVVLVISFGKTDETASKPVAGALLMLGSVVAWALYTVLAKRVAHADETLITAVSMSMASVMLIPLVLFELRDYSWPTLTGAAWLNILYLGVVASGAAFVIYNRALRDLDASAVGVWINLAPIIGVVSAVLFLGESLHPWQIAGAVIALAGMWLSS